jgi:hypothetical protein
MSGTSEAKPDNSTVAVSADPPADEPKAAETVSSSSTTTSLPRSESCPVSDVEPVLASNNQTENPKTLRTRAVSFDRVEIREYSRCLGNNPATTHGPPLSIDWAYNKAGTFQLDDYESTRPPRRISQQMLVPGFIREEILMDQTNVTKRQINATIAAIQVDRHRRQICVAMQEFEEWHIPLETIRRRLRRFKKGISKQREEELLWENAAMIMAEKQTIATKTVDAEGNIITSPQLVTPTSSDNGASPDPASQ